MLWHPGSAHPAREAEGIREREDALAHLADRDDNVAPVAAHRAPDDGPVGPIRRMCGERGEGGAGQRDADIVVSPTPSPSLLPLMNRGTDERDKRPPWASDSIMEVLPRISKLQYTSM